PADLSHCVNYKFPDRNNLESCYYCDVIADSGCIGHLDKCGAIFGSSACDNRSFLCIHVARRYTTKCSGFWVWKTSNERYGEDWLMVKPGFCGGNHCSHLFLLTAI